MGEDEEAMLSEAFYVKANSPWAVKYITENLEGLELELAQS
jgi:2Fe-2S ferredoxin